MPNWVVVVRSILSEEEICLFKEVFVLFGTSNFLFRVSTNLEEVFATSTVQKMNSIFFNLLYNNVSVG